MVGAEQISFSKEEFKQAVEEIRKKYGKVVQKLVAEKLGISYPTYMRERDRLGINIETVEVSKRDKTFDNKIFTEEEFGDYFNNLEKKKTKDSYDIFKYKFDESLILKFIADPHLGSDTVLYNQFWKDIMFIKHTPNCKTVLVGDYIDNFTKYSPGSAVYDQVIPPAEQKQTIEKVVKFLGKDKILGIIQGCHDEWSYRNDTFELGRYLAEHIDVPYLGFDGILELKVGENKYTVYVAHRDRYFTKYNLCHGLKRTWREEHDFDLGVSAHRHRADYEEVVEKGRTYKCLKLSGYKDRDRFLRQKKKEKFVYVDQFIVLLAEKVKTIDKGILYFTDREDVLRFI